MKKYFYILSLAFASVLTLDNTAFALRAVQCFEKAIDVDMDFPKNDNNKCAVCTYQAGCDSCKKDAGQDNLASREACLKAACKAAGIPPIQCKFNPKPPEDCFSKPGSPCYQDLSDNESKIPQY